MKASLLNKLDTLQDRFEELTALLGDGEVIADQAKFRAYSKEYAELEPVVQGYKSCSAYKVILKAPRRCSRTATRTCVKWPWKKSAKPRSC